MWLKYKCLKTLLPLGIVFFTSMYALLLMRENLAIRNFVLSSKLYVNSFFKIYFTNENELSYEMPKILPYFVTFTNETFKEETKDYWERVEYFTKVTLPAVPDHLLRTRKMQTNFTYYGFEKLELIKNMIANNTTLKVTDKNMFVDYDLLNQPGYAMPEDRNVYFKEYGNITCFIEGTQQATERRCICKAGWHGPACSIPEIMLHTTGITTEELLATVKIRKKPRRLVNLFTFNIELMMFEIRLAELDDTVDVYVIMESNITGYGDPKPLYLLSMLRRGYLEDYHNKIVYHYFDKFADEAYLDGWKSEEDARDVLGRVALTSRVTGLRDDDLVFYTDSDEIPKREVMLFLKLHDGYPQDIAINYHKRGYGFFWHDRPHVAHRWYSIVTFGFLRDIYQNHTFYLRNPTVGRARSKKELKQYRSKYNIKQWTIGVEPDHFAGWHCSYCFNPDGIRIKLQSIINEDYPRWGDKPESFDLERVKYKIIGQGFWFDGKSRFTEVKETNPDFAPAYVLKNKEKFKHLVVNQYKINPHSNKTKS